MRTPPNERLTSDISGKGRSRAGGSERRCILSGDSGERSELLRLAISPPDADGVCQVLPDPAAKAPGRGAWIGVDRVVLEQALSDGSLKRAMLRAFKGAKLSIPNDLVERIAASLQRSLTERLGLELRAGQIVLGSARIAEQARSGRIALLLHANDSSEDGRRKLDQAWRVGSDAEGSGWRGEVLPLDRAALSVALGRDNVVHLGVAGRTGGGGAAGRVMQALARLKAFAGGVSAIPDAEDDDRELPATEGLHDCKPTMN
jgi:uncharacterized protein